MRLGAAVRGRVRLALAGVRPRGGGRGARSVWLDIVLVVVFAAFVLQAASLVFERLADRATPPELAGAVLGMLLTTAFAALALFEVHLALSTLLLDSDLELLRAAPIGAGELLGLKLLDAAPATGALYLVFAVPAILAFGAHYPLPPWAWLAAPVLLLALWLIPLGAGMALALLVLRVMPPRLVRRALGLASTLTVAAMLVTNALVLPRLMESGERFALSLSALAARMDALAPVLPPVWAAQALAQAAALEAHATSEPATTLMAVMLRMLMLVAAAMAAMGLLAAVARTSLDPVLGRLAAGPGRGVARGDAVVRMGRGTRAHPLAALVRRDVRLFVRDWPVLSDVVLASFLWPLAALLLPQAEAAPAVLFARALVVMLAAGVGIEIATRSVPLEREATAWNRMAGVPSARWALAKALATAALGLPLLVIALTVILRLLEVPAAAWAELTATALAAFTLSVALGVWLGALFGDPGWRHPRAMLRLGGRLLSTLLVVVQAVGWLVALGVLESALGPGHPLAVVGPPLVAGIGGALAIGSAGDVFRRRGWQTL